MGHRIIFRKDTPYQRITVAENSSGSLRFLYSSRKDEKQGGIYLEDPVKLYFEYCRVSLVSLAFLGREPRGMLFVGLGAGSLPRYLKRHYPSSRIDIAEVDAEVLEAARKYFFFQEAEGMEVHISDGREFLRRAGRAYDIVFLDAYRVREIPYHLSTLEFLGEARARLRQGGVVVSNVVGREKNCYFDSMVATYKRAFPYVYIFEGVSSFNNVIIASEEGVDRRTLIERARAIQRERRMDVRLQKLAERPYHTPRARPGEKVLTDGRIPLEANPGLEIPDFKFGI